MEGVRVDSRTASAAYARSIAAAGQPQRESAISQSRCLLMEAIEAGALDQQGPFGRCLPMPYSGTSGRPYHGQNIFLLAAVAQSKGYEEGGWVTANGATSRGWQINKGERHTKVFFYQPVEVRTGEQDPETGEEITETRPLLRAHRVFNISQLDTSRGKRPAPPAAGIVLPSTDPTDNAVKMLDRIADGMGVEILHDQKADSATMEDGLITVPGSSSKSRETISQIALAMLDASFTEGMPGRPLSQTPELREAELHLRHLMAERLLGMRLGFPLAGGTTMNADLVVKAMESSKTAGLRAAGDAEAAVRYLLSFDPEQAPALQAEGKAMHDEVLDAGGSDDTAFDGAAIDFGYVEERTSRGVRP